MKFQFNLILSFIPQTINLLLTFFITLMPFYMLIINLFISKLVIKNLFFWKTTNYADSYWFLYSNKKVLYESRYL